MVWTSVLKVLFLSFASALDDYDTCRHECMNDKNCAYSTFEQGRCLVNTFVQGMARSVPATSCLQSWNLGLRRNGLYWIDTPSGVVQTVCDMENGGWTLVGEVGGTDEDKYLTWLRDNHNVKQLQDTEIQEGSYSCLDAVNIAVHYATKIRLTNGNSDFRMGSKWVEWELPADRENNTFWNVEQVSYIVSRTKVASPMTVTNWMGQMSSCYQTMYGLLNYVHYGASYPSTAAYSHGAVIANDGCMAVDVIHRGGSYNGWYNNGNGRDCPIDDTDWPNARVNNNCFLSVWLK